MIRRLVVVMVCVACSVFGVVSADAQDVPGIEICTAEKTMERRTSCLQSNIEFLQKTIVKLRTDHEQKLDAAKAEIAALKASFAALQKVAGDLQATQQKLAEELTKKTDAAPSKDASASKETPAKENAAKEGGK